MQRVGHVAAMLTSLSLLGRQKSMEVQQGELQQELTFVELSVDLFQTFLLGTLVTGEPGFASSALSLSADTCWTTRVMLERELRRIIVSSISSFFSISGVNIAEPF